MAEWEQVTVYISPVVADDLMEGHPWNLIMSPKVVQEASPCVAKSRKWSKLYSINFLIHPGIHRCISPILSISWKEIQKG